MTGKLSDFELDVLEQVAGHRDDIPWGAAVGEALGALAGHGMIHRSGYTALLTDAGWEELERRGKEE